MNFRTSENAIFVILSFIEQNKTIYNTSNDFKL